MKAASALQMSSLRFHDILAKLRKSSFFKNTLVVMSGTAVAQILGFALTPIISRLFTPLDFGVFGSFNAVLSTIAAGATLEYTQAIMLPKEKEEAINLFCVSGLSTFTVGLLCFAFCLIAPSFVNGIMQTAGVWALALLVVAIVVAGFNQSCQAWCVRTKAFKHTAASQVLRSLSANGSQVGFGCLKGGAAGLIVSSVLADMLASLNMARVVVRDLRVQRHDIRWSSMRRLAMQYRDFPMYSATMNVINALSQGLPVLLLTNYYGIAVAGAYAFGVRILQAPMGLVLRALRQVLFQKACETHNQCGRLVPLYVKTTLGLFALAFLPSLILLIWAPQLFTWIFGSQWLTAGEFARSLMVWMVFMFCNVPSVLFGRILRIQRKMFILDIVLLVSRTLVLIVGGMYLPASYTILLFSLLGAGMNVIFIVIVGYVLIKKEAGVTEGAFQGV